MTVRLDGSRRPYTPQTLKFEDIPPHHVIIQEDYTDDVFWGLAMMRSKCRCKLHKVGAFDIAADTSLKRLRSSSSASSGWAPPDDNGEADDDLLSRCDHLSSFVCARR